jgi:hypothetical protein
MQKRSESAARRSTIDEAVIVVTEGVEAAEETACSEVEEEWVLFVV